jgi:hypothetical protein
MTSSDYSARGPKLGYLYQVRHALYVVLKSGEDEKIAFEKLDDVQFEADGEATELLQYKHSVNAQATLSDRSAQLWKSIGNWSEQYSAGQIDKDTKLSLLTTASAPTDTNSLARSLRPDRSRDNGVIVDRLDAIAVNSDSNQSLKSRFEVYMALSRVQKLALVANIQVLDGEPNIWATPAQIKSEMREHPQHVDFIYERLIGWWDDRVIQHLGMANDAISRVEVILKLSDIREQFQSDSLTIDYRDAEPPEEWFLNQDKQQFVQQLTRIGMHNPRIEAAIRDYYRAFSQRTRWVEEKQVNFDQLGDYEEELRQEWQQHLFQVLEDLDDERQSEEGKVKAGREIFRRVYSRDIPMRQNMPRAGYVMRGTFQILADFKPSPKVWWHPEFIQRLESVLLGDEKPVEENQDTTTDPDKAIPEWKKRPVEVTNLFNSAFCSVLIYDALKGFAEEKSAGMPFKLAFFVLPILLHKPIRDLMPRSIRTQLHPWLQDHPQLLPLFPERLQALTTITRESLIFGMHHEAIASQDALLSAVPYKKLKNRAIDNADGFDISEIKEIRKQAFLVGRWFGRSADTETIMQWWGIGEITI